MQFFKKILVLAPHTDDAELGCGGTLARFASLGAEIHIATFSTCAKSLPAGLPADTLEKETKLAIQQLGLPAGRLMLYDFEVREFTSKRQEILDELISLRKYIQPDLVLLPAAGDIHQDHHVVHTEGLRAFKDCSIWGYELPWNQTTIHSSIFVKLSEKELEKKINAVQAYKSQLHRPYAAPETLEAIARVRGLQSGSVYAESFELIRLHL